MAVLSVVLFQEKTYASSWRFNDWPTYFLENVVDKANGDTDAVQDTALDSVTSKGQFCDNGPVGSTYTFSNTLCFIKNNLYHYLQYVVYVWLAAATILLIWNWFLLVVSDDNAKQIWEFRKNAKSIGIWVILLIAFYIIIEIFVSIVNLIAE